jgi:uncharacterized protein YerC
MAISRNLGPKIRTLLAEGKSNRTIVKTLGVSSATVSYHAGKLGLRKGPRATYDWTEVSRFLAEGNTIASARDKFGMSKAAIDKARERGAVQYATVARMTASEYGATAIVGRAKSHHRRVLRSKLLREGREYRCAECGITEWHGNRLSLEVDHEDGDSRNNHPANLRLLCPNCHSVTPTWRGRNVGRYE